MVVACSAASPAQDSLGGALAGRRAGCVGPRGHEMANERPLRKFDANVISFLVWTHEFTVPVRIYPCTKKFGGYPFKVSSFDFIS